MVRRSTLGAALTALLACAVSHANADPGAGPAHVGHVCDLIESHSQRNGLPADFLARLIWKESRFDPDAVSPKGAEGIAQFMPGTAAMRGLADPFDIDQAIPASAAYLARLTERFGNLGLAAAAYNAGEARVSRWLSKGGFLPLETENYVLDIVGEPADQFVERSRPIVVPLLDPKQGFADGCRSLPVSGAAVTAMAGTPSKPWGIQVAGHFRRNVAILMWERTRKKHPGLFEGLEPVVSRVRSTHGRMGIHAVRIGADSRTEAARICSDLRKGGAACVVMRNR